MSDPATPKGRNQLGRGLSALFGEEPKGGEAVEPKPTDMVPIARLSPNPNQPRRRFDEEDLRELAASIEAHGVLQPILARVDPKNPQRYQIVAGERRWRAAQLARRHDVPVIVKELSDSHMVEIAIVENVQRQDLNAMEEAEGYRQLAREYNYRQDDLALAVGKSRSHIANTLRLLNLPDEVQSLVRDGALSAGHARALLSAERPLPLARLIVKQGLSVREAEKLAQAKGGGAAKKAPPQKDPDTLALEKSLTQQVGLKVTLNDRGNKGEVVIHYNDLEQLDAVLNLLRRA